MYIILLSMCVYKINNRHRYDDYVAGEAEPVGDLCKKNKAEKGGKEDLGVFVDGDFVGGGVIVGGGYGKLTTGGTASCTA